MKKNRLYITTALLSMGLLTGLTGCGSNSENTDAVETLSSTANNAKELAEGATEGEEISDRSSKGSKSSDNTSSGSTVKTSAIDVDDQFSKRDLDPSYDASEAETITLSETAITASGSGATVGNTTSGAPNVTISKAGVYVVSGTLSAGQIVVDAGDDDKVQLVLSGVTMTNSDSACIYVKNADKVFVTLADGTTNTLSDTGAEFVQEDEDTNVDGVIYARDDIVFNGSGTLNVTAKTKHAIVGKDDLKVTGGTYNITAAAKGISANDSIRIKAGTFTIDSEDDALHTSNGDEEGRGYIYIEDGTFDLSTRDDGIHAETDLLIRGGKINVKESYEGIEGYTITVDGGEISIVASDDGMNAAGGSNSGGKGGFGGNFDGNSDGNFQGKGDFGGKKNTDDSNGSGASTDESDSSWDGRQGGRGGKGGRGQMPDFQNGEMPEKPNGGQMPDFQNGEMPEMSNGGQMPDFQNGERPEMPDGEMPDMQNGNGGGFPGGNGGNFPGGGGGMMMDADENAVIVINDGTIYINANGDGLDSNGYLTVNGGVIYVDGPTNNGNGALDSGLGLTVNGGTVIAVGSSGMAEGFGSSSTQKSFKYDFGSAQSGGTELELLDSTGTAIFKYTPSKQYSSVVFSSADLKEGTYTVKAGSTEGSVTVK